MLKQIFVTLGVLSTFGAGCALAATYVPTNYGNGTKPLRSGPVMACIGDSECSFGTVALPAGTTYRQNGQVYNVGTQSNSMLGWLNVVSGGAFAYDYINQGYPGNYFGLYYARILVQGTGCPASTVITVTPSAPSSAVSPGGVPVTPANLTMTTDANGNTPVAGTTLYEPVGTAQGGGYLNFPTFTLSATCSTPPVWGYAFTGTGTWGVPYETTQNTLSRIQNEICAAQPDWGIYLSGTNDLSQGVAEATINANTLAGLQAMEACGIRPILMDISARVNGTVGWTQTLDKERLRINAWRRNLAMLSISGNIPSTTGLPNYPSLPFPILYVDTDHFWVNTANTCTSSCAAGAFVGDAQSSYTADGIHQSPIGSFTKALAIWQAVYKYVPAALQYMPNSQDDLYDATNNPMGNLIGTAGLFVGTAGVATAPCTTSSGMASGWTLTETGNASMSCVGTIQTSRPDGYLGNQQIITVSDTGGTVNDTVNIANYPSITGNLSAGDQVYFEGDVDMSNLNQVKYVNCQLTEDNTINQQSSDLFAGTSTGYNGTYPNLVSATIAKWPEAKNLPNFGLTASGSFRRHFRTPPIIVQSGDTGWNEVCTVNLNGASGTATATLAFSNFAVRKVTSN